MKKTLKLPRSTPTSIITAVKGWEIEYLRDYIVEEGIKQIERLMNRREEPSQVWETYMTLYGEKFGIGPWPLGLVRAKRKGNKVFIDVCRNWLGERGGSIELPKVTLISSGNIEAESNELLPIVEDVSEKIRKWMRRIGLRNVEQVLNREGEVKEARDFTKQRAKWALT